MNKEKNVADKATQEEGFRRSIEDVILIVNKLHPVCSTFEDLVGVLELSLNNDAQLKLLMQQVLGKK